MRSPWISTTTKHASKYLGDGIQQHVLVIDNRSFVLIIFVELNAFRAMPVTHQPDGHVEVTYVSCFIRHGLYPRLRASAMWEDAGNGRGT